MPKRSSMPTGRTRKSPVRAIALFSVLGLLAVTAFLFEQYLWLDRPAFTREAPPLVQIDSGTGLSLLANRLGSEALLTRPQSWKLYALLSGQAKRIRAGEYELELGITPRQMLQKFVRGEVKQYRITLVEGWNFTQVRAELARHPKLQQLLADKTAAEIMAALGKAGEHPEGRFYPDSYSYVAGTTDIALLTTAYNRLGQILRQEWETRGEALPYASAYEALIMASIIEKETAVAAEREQIAGVFVRRLQNNMRLQTDPTVIYNLGDSFDGNLRREHLTADGPYNTYRIRGLPPTPIAMAGRASIRAALHPAPGTALYFVAKGDGSHVFSDTLEAHNRAVRAYQLNRTENYRSTP